MLYLTAKTGLLTQEDGDEGVGREEEEKRQRNLYFKSSSIAREQVSVPALIGRLIGRWSVGLPVFGIAIPYL